MALMTKSQLKGKTMNLVRSTMSKETAEAARNGPRSTWRRRFACYGLGIGMITGGLAIATPLAAEAQGPQRTENVQSASGIEPNSLSQIVSYNKGFATVAADKAGDILLFTKATGATSWARSVIYNAANDGVGMSSPAVAGNGKNLAIVAYEDDTNFLFAWIGNLAHGFVAEVVSSSASKAFFSPSIAYSPFGKNYVVTDTDDSGDIDYWYSTTASGGWQEQSVA